MVRLRRAEEPEPDVSGLPDHLRHCKVEDWVSGPDDPEAAASVSGSFRRDPAGMVV